MYVLIIAATETETVASVIEVKNVSAPNLN